VSLPYLWVKTGDPYNVEGQYVPYTNEPGLYDIPIGTATVALVVSSNTSALTPPAGKYGANVECQQGSTPEPEPSGPPYMHEDGDWGIVSNSGSYYVTTNMADQTPAWYKSTVGGPTGTYDQIQGEGIYGVVVVGEGESIYPGGHPVLTNSWESPAGRVVEFWQCWLWKTGATNDVFVSTNIGHKSKYWILAEKIGQPEQDEPYLLAVHDRNTYYDQGLDLVSNVWNLAYTATNWITNSASDPFYFGEDVSAAPAICATPFTNTSTLRGFQWTPSPTMEWEFRYATNRYW